MVSAKECSPTALRRHLASAFRGPGLWASTPRFEHYRLCCRRRRSPDAGWRRCDRQHGGGPARLTIAATAEAGRGGSILFTRAGAASGFIGDAGAALGGTETTGLVYYTYGGDPHRFSQAVRNACELPMRGRRDRHRNARRQASRQRIEPSTLLLDDWQSERHDTGWSASGWRLAVAVLRGPAAVAGQRQSRRCRHRMGTLRRKRQPAGRRDKWERVSSHL